MLASADKVKQTVEQSARIMDEYKQRLSEVLEEEVERIGQEAEQEAAAVLAKARETAQQIISQAKIEKDRSRGASSGVSRRDETEGRGRGGGLCSFGGGSS